MTNMMRYGTWMVIKTTKTLFALSTLTIILVSLSQFPVEGHVDFMIHVNASGTQLGRPDDDPNFYFTHSNLPHLPRLNGFVGSHGKSHY